MLSRSPVKRRKIPCFQTEIRLRVRMHRLSLLTAITVTPVFSLT